MTRTINDLDVRIRDLSAIQVRFPKNQAYLQGTSAHPVLGGEHERFRSAGYVIMAASVSLLLLYLVFIVFIWLWTSPFTATTEGTIDGLAEGWDIVYSYEVDGVRYEKVEPSSSRNPGWADGGVPQRIVYLSFWPAQSRLPGNIEDMEWFPVICGGGMIVAFIMWRFALLRNQRRMSKLAREATHILAGTIAHVGRLYRGTMVATYHADAPTGEQISGTFNIAARDATQRRIFNGTQVAILYRDETMHSIL